MATGSPQLLQLLNTLSGEQYAKMMAESPHLKGWVNETNYQHPSMMKNIQANYQDQTTSNLGIGGPTMRSAYPVASDPSGATGRDLSTPYKFPLQHTPTDRAVMPEAYPYIMKHQDPSSVPSSFVSGTGADLSSALPASSRAVGTSGSFTSGAGEVFANQQAKEAVAKSIVESGAEAGADGAGFLASLGGKDLWQGPAPALANMALSAIPTRDREKVDTPIGDQGSTSGMLKGAGKGALTGATIGSQIAPGVGTAWGAGIGGVVGLLGGAQGYFDTTSPPTITRMGLLRGRGGQLSAPKGMYG